MINYVSAQDGGLVFHTEDDEVFSSANIDNLVEFALNKGFSVHGVFGSSSMDFAAEEGFETNDGASKMLNAVITRYNLFTEGVV